MNPGRLGRSAVALCALFAALGMVGCSSPDDDDVEEISTLTGVITGTLLDTSGAPIVGATVRYSGNTDAGIGETTAQSNASGQFVLEDISVTGVSTIGSNDANGPITLVVESPADTPTMGATVEVEPIAQSSSTAGNQVFIDDFNVDTGPVRIPRLASTVRGTLRHASTGAPLAETTVTLDFLGVEFEQDGTTGIASTYNAGSNRTATSDASGAFVLSQVYDDSCLRMNVAGVSVVSVSGSAPPCNLTGSENPDASALYFATSLDGGTTQLANVYVQDYDSEDTIAPQVAAVAGVVDASVSPAPLASSVTGLSPNALTVEFSEPMQSLVDADDVSVVVGSAPDQYIAELASVTQPTSTQLVIALDTALPAATDVDVLIAREALRDLAGNAVTLSDALAYDGYDGSANQFLALSLSTFAAVDVTPPFATGVVGVDEAQANPGVLDASVTGTGGNPLVVVFSEPLQNLLSAGNVEVLIGSGSAQIPASVVGVELVGGTDLHIQLDEALPVATALTLRLDAGMLVDFAGNEVALNGALAYDTFGGDGGEWLVLRLLTADGVDSVAPVVASMSDVVDLRASVGVLRSGVTGVAPDGLKVNFSESMLTPVAESDLRVLLDPDGSAELLTLAGIDFDGLRLTVNLVDPLPASTPLQLRLSRSAFRDQAGNLVTAGLAVNFDRVAGDDDQWLVLDLASAPAG